MIRTRAWKCRSGHILGEVRRRRGRWELWLYRKARYLDPQEDVYQAPAAVMVMAHVSGTVTGIRCSICGARRSWFAGEEGMERLLGERRVVQAGKHN